MDECRVGVAGCGALADALAVNTGLRTLQLTDNSELPISRTYLKAVKAKNWPT